MRLLFCLQLSELVPKIPHAGQIGDTLTVLGVLNIVLKFVLVRISLGVELDLAKLSALGSEDISDLLDNERAQ